MSCKWGLVSWFQGKHAKVNAILTLKANEGYIADYDGFMCWVHPTNGGGTERVQGWEQTANLPSWKVDVLEVLLGWTPFNTSLSTFRSTRVRLNVYGNEVECLYTFRNETLPYILLCLSHCPKIMMMVKRPIEEMLLGINMMVIMVVIMVKHWVQGKHKRVWSV